MSYFAKTTATHVQLRLASARFFDVAKVAPTLQASARRPAWLAERRMAASSLAFSLRQQFATAYLLWTSSHRLRSKERKDATTEMWQFNQH
jgi:hypothetical protein